MTASSSRLESLSEKTAEEPVELDNTGVYRFANIPLVDPKLVNEKTLSIEEEDKSSESEENSLDELSDITEDYDRIRSANTSRISGLWHSRLRPLFHHPHMKYVALANLILFFIIVILLGLLVSLSIVATVFHYEAIANNAQDIPCIYEWTEWSECSATCRSHNSEHPTKSRRVNDTTIVRARGKLYDTARCPEGVMSLTETVPCNTYYCPIKLSELPFNTTCQLSKLYGKHIQLRSIPLTDQLILLDEDKIYQDCKGKE